MTEYLDKWFVLLETSCWLSAETSEGSQVRRLAGGVVESEGYRTWTRGRDCYG